MVCSWGKLYASWVCLSGRLVYSSVLDERSGLALYYICGLVPHVHVPPGGVYLFFIFPQQTQFTRSWLTCTLGLL